jgi:hypothetical protein
MQLQVCLHLPFPAIYEAVPYFLRLYFSMNASLSSSEMAFIYAFHPGQKPICQRQKRPANDFGLLSYLARNLQFTHGMLFLSIF